MALSRFYALFSVWLFPSVTMKRRWWPLVLGALYVLVIKRLGGFRTDHLIFGLLPMLDAYNERTRAFLKCFFPFVLTGVVFDSMRYYYWAGVQGHIHISEPYLLEKYLFGIGQGTSRITPNEYFDRHSWAGWDLLCGFAYLTFVAEYLCLAFWLFFKNELRLANRFGWCFFSVNLIGFITYFVYPAAPPWYISQYGLGPARLDAVPSAAAAVRFDALLGTHFFDHMYGRGIDVFGAYPSLHVAYPLLVCFVTFRMRRVRSFAVLFYLLMCFSAVYLQHHYVIDVLLGSLYASLTWGVWNWIHSRKAALTAQIGAQ